MTSTVTTEIAQQYRDLAATLTRNAEILTAAGLPDAVVSTRATVYRDVASQLRLLADVELERAAGNPLVVAVPENEVVAGVARRFGLLAELLTANARVLTRRTADAVLLRRAAVYRDVASQVRMLADEAAERATALAGRQSRPPLSNLAPLNPLAVDAATRAPGVRAVFLDKLVDSIARRRRHGWSVARLTLWLRTTLRDPQTDAVHPCAQREFVSYITGQLAAAGPRAA